MTDQSRVALLLESSAPILVRARALGGYLTLINQLGGNSDVLLQAAGLTSAQLEDPDSTIGLARAVNLLELSARELKVKDLGLRLASFQDISVLGPAALLMRYAATIGEALDAIRCNLSYHSPGINLELEAGQRDGYTQIRVHLVIPTQVSKRQATELAYGVLVRIIRFLSSNVSDEWEVWLTHDDDFVTARYREHFHCRVRLGQNHDALIVPTSLLSVQIKEASFELSQMAERIVTNIVRRFPLDIASQIETLVIRQLSTGRCTLSIIARQLMLHERTVQRRLREQGIYFEDIVDQVRRARALELLPYVEIPLQQVANLLGYDEQSSFNRACKRWFGKSPLVIRQQIK